MKVSKSGAALISILSNTSLIVLKLIAGGFSGSVSILSEALHSGMDLMASLIAFFSVRVADRPPDKSHPYGHGKVENLSAVIEAFLLLAAAGFIILEAFKKILSPEPIRQTSLAITVMLFSMVLNIAVSRLLSRVAKREDSIALAADALHLKTDVYTSLGIALGLVLIHLTHWDILDPIIAIGTALFILYETQRLLRQSLGSLLDAKLTETEEQLIVAVIEKYRPRIYNYHDLKTRRSGSLRCIEFHLELDPTLSILDFEQIADEMEKDIALAMKHPVVTSIHVETPQAGTSQDYRD